MDEETKKSAKEGSEYLENWLKNFGKASEVAPIVRQAYDRKKWEADAISNAPDEVDEIPHSEVKISLDLDNEYWKTVLPPMPEYDPHELVSTAPSSNSTGTIVYDLVSRAGDIPTSDVYVWSVKYTERYEALQQSANRRDEVRGLLGKLKTELADEFDQAVESYEAAIGGWQERSAAGIAMRNVLEHYKGQLFERAINRPKEQKIKWPTMADRLSLSVVGSIPHQQLLNQENIWAQLHQRLTDVAKGLQAGSATDLKTLYTEFLDHLYVVLSLAKIK